MSIKNLLSFITIILTLSSCVEEVKVKFEPYYITDYKGETKEFTFIGLDSMTIDNSIPLDKALHELVSDDMQIDANIIAQVVDYNADSVLLKKDSLETFVAFTKGAFPLRGRLKDQFVVLNSKLTRKPSKAFGVEQSFTLELSSMMVLKQFSDVK